jgi:hypothetical protein
MEQRGLSLAGMTDDEIEAAIEGGYQTLQRAQIDGGDVTAAFFTVVRKQSKS